MTIGQLVWTKLRLHPKVTAAVYANGGNATGGGTPVAQQALADVLEIDEIIVGKAWQNAAKPGQAVNTTRLWGKHCSLMYRSKDIQSATDSMTFGITGQWGDRVAGNYELPKVGLRGAVGVKTGESVKELILAADAGYFFQNAVV